MIFFIAVKVNNCELLILLIQIYLSRKMFKIESVEELSK